ncbi:MAG TPA: glycosyltransferase family 87 protein, partial [Gemmataceae bacterium]|nr:glycosyltransferase family 87 protein [Gemmataceae bacterium]
MYYSAALWLQGEDMYGWNPATPAKLDEDTKVNLWNMNPPHYHLVMLPLALLPRGPALVAWWVVNLLLLAWCLRRITRELGIELTPRVRQLGLLGLLAFCATGSMILTSQLSFLLLVPMTLMWVDARQGRWARAGLWLGLALSVKPFLLLLVPYLLLKRRWSAVATCTLAAAACFAVGLAVFGVGSHLSWYGKLGISDGWAWFPLNASLFGALNRTFTPTHFFTPLAVAAPEHLRLVFLGLGAVIGLLTVWSAARDDGPGGLDRAFALLVVASVLLCPLGWTYYFWLPLGPMAAVLLEWRRQRQAPAPAPWHRRLVWLALLGVFWPVQLVAVLQPFWLSTL